MPFTQYQRVVDALLRTHGHTLPDFVLDADADGKTAHAISRELYDLTDGAIDVTSQAVRNWLEQFRNERAGASA